MKHLNRIAVCLTIVLANVNLLVYSAAGRMGSKAIRSPNAQAALATASTYWLWKDYQNKQSNWRHAKSDAETLKAAGKAYYSVPDIFTWSPMPKSSLSDWAWNKGFNWYMKPASTNLSPSFAKDYMNFYNMKPKP